MNLIILGNLLTAFFLESEGVLSSSQEFIIVTYPEPAESSLHIYTIYLILLLGLLDSRRSFKLHWPSVFIGVTETRGAYCCSLWVEGIQVGNWLII
jgi:hypothetical protein